MDQGGDNPCVEYLVFGVERGDSGTPHLQGFVQFNSRKTLAQVKAALGTTRVHLEIARGTATEADEYCRKEGGEIFTRATIRLSANERRRQQGCERRDTHQEQCKALIASIKAKKPRLELLESNLHMAKELNLLAELRPPRTKAPKVIYIYSETGIGKTTTTTRYLERHSMSSLVPPNGGPATTTNQSASSRSSQAVSRVLHSSSYVTLSNSRSKSKAVSYNLTPHTSSCLLMSVERNSTRTSQIADVLLSKDVSKGNFKFGHTRCWIRNYSGKLCSMETIVDKLYQLNYDTISSEKAATVVYIPFLCDFTMMLFVIIIVSFIVQLQQTSQPQAITILASTL